MSIAYLVRVFLVCRLLVTFVIASGTNPSLVSPEDHTYNLLLQFNVTKPSPQFLQSHPPSLSLSSNGNNEEDLLKLQKEPHKSDNQNDNKNVQKTSSHSTASANSSHHHHHHHHTIHHNLSSPAFQNIAKHTLHVMHHHCLRTHFYETNNPHNHVYPERFIFPADAEQHFAEIQAAVQPFVTQNRIHSYAGYDGPWIENLWISTFSKKPLGYFRGFIPIFLNWIDSEIVKNMGRMIQALSRVLRKDCVYITVSQGDAGLHEAAALFPNILVLSAGGFGHIPLPLIKGELPPAPLVETDKHLPSQRVPSDHNVFSSSRSSSNNKYYYDVEVSFYGTDRRERHNLLMAVSAESEKQNLSFTIGYGKDWQQRMAHTRVNLAPRGYGRSSFRFAEVVQLGRIPLFLYDDFLWLPFQYTPKNVTTFGFAARLREVPQVMERIAKMSDSEYLQRLQKVQEIRKEYTYAGVMQQIEMFIQDPLGPHGGDLLCVQHPRTFFCCG